MAVYIVKSGDTLSKIAREHGTTVHTLMTLNKDIKDKNVIRVGQAINLPSAIATKPAAPEKDYAAIGQKVESCLTAIENLPEFIALEGLLHGNGN